MIHVSDLLNYEKCHRLAWNRIYNKLPYRSFYHMDIPFSKLWKKYLGIENCATGKIGDTNAASLQLLHRNKIVTNIRFEYNECRTRIPVLKKIDGGYEAIYPHLSAYPKESEALVMKVNAMIAEQAGIPIVKNRIIYLNRDYVRNDALDVHTLLRDTDRLFNRRNNLHLTIQMCMDKLDFDLDEWIKKTHAEIRQKTAPATKRTKRCTSGRRCAYYSICFDESDEPDDSVLFLTTSRNKFKAYEQGTHRISDLDIHELDGFRLQYSQYMASKNGMFVDHLAIKNWLSHIQYPISYLDFEWDTFAIPPYRGMKPFDVLCFQYSLHIENKNQKLIHKDFFDYGDCRESFIRSILKNVPKTGSILVYNREGAEQLRLNQLAEQFPSYKKDLDRICDRMVDLSKPFEAGLIYDNRMRGHYSLKNVLPCFTDTYSYEELSIQDGLHAVNAYRIFEKASEATRRTIRRDIRTYCRMDTFAEYIVYHGILKLEKENENA